VFQASPVSLVDAEPRPVQLSVFALQSSETAMPSSEPNAGPHEERQKIANCFFSAFNVNCFARVLCGFFSVKRKLFRLLSHLKQLFWFPLCQFQTLKQKTGTEEKKSLDWKSSRTCSFADALLENVRLGSPLEVEHKFWRLAPGNQIYWSENMIR
jgi:hypothetical protein